MPPKIPPDLLPRTRQILLPLVETPDDREALLTEAFYLLPDSRLYHQIKRDGNAMSFTTLCFKTLIDYGCVTDDTHALGQLLTTARMYCGKDKHSEIDTLAATANTICTDPEPRIVDEPPPAPAVTETMRVQTIATPRDDRTPTVFISYSHADDEFAQKLIADLNAAGHACWIDTARIKSGDEWVRSITEGINNSYAFISIVSEAANESTWVRREFLWAEYKNKLIFPVMAQECELVIYLMERQLVFMHTDYAAGLAQLLAGLPQPVVPSADKGDDDALAVEILRGEKAPVNRRRLELDYLEQLRAEALFDLEKYTPLGGESQFVVKMRRGETIELAFMRPEFEHLIRDDEHTKTRRFDNAVDEILTIKRAVLLGEPGGGKTTTFLSLAGKLADEAQKDVEAPIPIFVRLGRWTDADQSLTDFIAEELGGLGAHLDTLFAEGRAVPLLDGMNEIPVKQRERKYQQIREFITRYPDWVAVASCRERDYTVELELDKITVTPLDAPRVREFVTRYLGDERGEALFWKIAGGDDVRRAWGAWEKAGATLALFFTANDIPRKNPNVYSSTSGQDDQIWREKVKSSHNLMQLAHNPYMLAMLTQVYVARGDLPANRGALFADFVETLLVREHIVSRDKVTKQVQMTDEARQLLRALGELAYEMQVQRGEADDGNALTVLPVETVQRFLSKDQLYLAASTSLLDVSDDDVRFTHQLLQEYFAAKYMDIEIAAGRLKADSIWKPENWWERTNWEEAVILLAGLYSDDCSPVVEWVNAANPEVVASCVMRSGAKLADATREKLRGEWLFRLTDTRREPNPKARAAIGRALGLTNWDNRKGVNVIIRDGVKLPDIDWVKIPAGDFTMGHERESDNPPRILTLDYDFHIARYPVTYAQFQTFIDDPDGYRNTERWFEGLAANDNHKQMGDQYFKYANHPRESVNWYQAIAFCRWFSWRLGGGYALDAVDQWAVRLPTEFEWEKAARANTGWKYPYGDEFDAAKGNTNATGIGQTSAVGIFPDGDTPHWERPLSDLSGNVWDWCLTDYNNPQMDATKENLSSSALRLLRGGAFYLDQVFARAVYRYYFSPDYRFLYYGFRVLCVRPPFS